MEITLNIPDALAKEVKRMASNESISISSFVSQALGLYCQKRKIAFGRKVLLLTRNVPLADDINRELDLGREDDTKRY